MDPYSNRQVEAMSSENLHMAAVQLAKRLADQDRKIVFAESCTAGLVSATLATVPGISQYHCGSAVVYRETTKTQWLGIRPDIFQQHSAVSEPVARWMALGVLQSTPEADLAAAITGHLGPDAPEAQDGLTFIAVAKRSTSNAEQADIVVHKNYLSETQRIGRQHEAAEFVLRRSFDALSH